MAKVSFVGGKIVVEGSARKAGNGFAMGCSRDSETYARLVRVMQTYSPQYVTKDGKIPAGITLGVLLALAERK